jgi:hypothetical protein
MTAPRPADAARQERTPEFVEGIRSHVMGCRFTSRLSAEWQAGWRHAQEIAMNARENAELRRHEKRCPWERDDDR